MHNHLYTRERTEAGRDHVMVPLWLRRREQRELEKAYEGSTGFMWFVKWLLSKF